MLLLCTERKSTSNFLTSDFLRLIRQRFQDTSSIKKSYRPDSSVSVEKVVSFPGANTLGLGGGSSSLDDANGEGQGITIY